MALTSWLVLVLLFKQLNQLYLSILLILLVVSSFHILVKDTLSLLQVSILSMLHALATKNSSTV